MAYLDAISREMRDCAKLCHECKDACLELIPHCLEMGGDHAAASHIIMLMDGAHICGTAEGFMHRGSPRHSLTCGACADICQACGDECDQLANGDQLMHRCAEICRRCAESCRMMAVHVTHA